MTNSYFNHNTPLARFTIADAVRLNGIFDAIEVAFDKLPSTDEINQGGRNFSIATGTANSYSATVNFSLSNYVAGLQVRVLIMIANTGSSTLNINSLGQVTIKRSDGTNLLPGDLRASSLNDFTFDGTNFRLTSFHGASEAISAASASTAVSAAASASVSQASAAASAVSAAASAVTATSSSTTAVGALNGARFGLKNLLLNNLFWISQRLPNTFSGTSPQSTFIRDRWGTFGASTSWSISNSTLTINSGVVFQIIQGRNVPFSGQYTLSWSGTASAFVHPSWPAVETFVVTSGVPFTLPGYQHCAVTFHSGTVYLPQLEFGGAKSSPELRPIDLELVLCSQYYQKSYAIGISPGTASATGPMIAAALNLVDLYTPTVIFSQEMRAAPSITIYSPLTGTAGTVLKVGPQTAATVTANLSTPKFFTLTSLAQHFTIDGFVQFHWTADAEL